MTTTEALEAGENYVSMAMKAIRLRADVRPALLIFKDDNPLCLVLARGIKDDQELDKLRIWSELTIFMGLLEADAYVYGHDTYQLITTPDEVAANNGEFPTPSERPESQEALMIQSRSGDEIKLTMTVYHRGDDGLLSFEAPREIPDGASGRMTKILGSAFSHREELEATFPVDIPRSELIAEYVRDMINDSYVMMVLDEDLGKTLEGDPSLANQVVRVDDDNASDLFGPDTSL